MFLPIKNLKAQFHPGDSLVLQSIMTNNFTGNTALNWTDPNPANWLGVVWNTATPKRVVELGLDQDGSVTGKAFHGGQGMGAIPAQYVGQIGAGVNAELTGILNLTGLAELKFLDLKNQSLLTNLNVTGLTNLNHFMTCNSGLTSLDFSGLSNLEVIHISGNGGITSVYTSNCSRLKYLKIKSNSLDTLNLNGNDSLVSLLIPNVGSISQLDVSGNSDLEFLVFKGSDVRSIVGKETLSSLIVLKGGRNDSLTGTFDFSDYDTANMTRFSVGSSLVDSVNNWTALSGNTVLEVVNVREANLTLSNATQIFNELSPSNNYQGDDQTRYGGDTIYTGGTTSYPGEDLIDINGTNIASTFTLFDFNGTQVGATNTTGVFNFPAIIDTGEYYVEMTNPGAAPANNTVNLRTDTFWVAECPQLDTVTSVSLTTITVAQTNATYQWLDCDNGNTVIAGATSQSYTATANGNYAVEITLGGVCKDTSACVNIATVGLDELSSNTTVRAYPNPMNEQVTIELQKVVANTQVTIVNVEGKVVYNNVVNTGKISVDGSTWSNGIYIVKITNEEYTKTLKLIK